MALKQEAVEALLQAMEIVSTAQLKDVSYDRTIVCTIVDNSRAAQESYYTVTDGSIKFKAFVKSTEEMKTYKNGDQVYVKIPNGNYQKEKTIEGYYVAEKSIVPVTYVAPLDTFLGISDLTQSKDSNWTNLTQSITANDPTRTQIPLWQWSIDPEYNSADDLQVNGIYDTIGIQASFRCLLDQYKVFAGSYGLRLDLYVRLRPTGTQHIIKSIELDSSEMFGNPYTFTVFAPQSKVVDITDLGTIDGMTLYLYQKNNFYYQDNRGQKISLPPEMVNGNYIDNIFVKDIYIALGSDIAAVEDNTIKLYNTEDLGFNYSQPGDSTNTKNLGFLWYNKSDEDGYVGFSDGIVDLVSKEIILTSVGQPDNNGFCVCIYTENGTTNTITRHQDTILTKDDGTKYIVEYTDEVIPYDELNYINLSTQNSKLVEQMGKDVPKDENGLQISANVSAARGIFAQAMKLIEINLINTLSDFYNRTQSLSQITVGDSNISSNEYFNAADTGKKKIAEAYGEALSVAYRELLDWYNGALSAAAAIEAHIKNKTTPEKDVVVNVLTNTYDKIKIAYTNFKANYISNEFIMNEIRMAIRDYYPGLQTVYDIYSQKVLNIFNILDEYFSELDELLLNKEKDITSSNREADKENSDYKYTMASVIIPYTERDFSHMSNRYCVYWYRAVPGHIDEDGLMEDGWKRLVPGELVKSGSAEGVTSIIPHNLGLPTTFIEKDGIFYFDKKSDQFLTVYLDPNKTEEKFKVVLFYNHEKFVSNELVFTNRDEIPDPTTLDSAAAITISHGNNSFETYQTSYASNNSLIKSSDALINRVLKVSYNGILGDNNSLSDGYLYWYVPRNTTMLSVNAKRLKSLGFSTDYYRTAEVTANSTTVRTGPGTNYATTGTTYSKGAVIAQVYDKKNEYYSLDASNTIGGGGKWISESDVIVIDDKDLYMEGFACFYKKVEFETTTEQVEDRDGNIINTEVQVVKDSDLEFEYLIKNYYTATALNNTIFCVFVKNDYRFETSISMIFGTQGTSGTDYTLLIQPSGLQTCATDSDILPLTVKLFDYNNVELDILNSTVPKDDYRVFNPTIKWRGPSTYNATFVSGSNNETVVNGLEVSTDANKSYFHSYSRSGITKNYPNRCGILEVYMGLSDERYGDTARELSALYPVAWSLGNYYIEGPTSIIYDSNGTNPAYYKEPYRIFDRDTNEEIIDVEWEIKYMMQSNVSYSVNNSVRPYYLISPGEVFNSVNVINTYQLNTDSTAVPLETSSAIHQEANFYRSWMPKIDKENNKLIPSNIYIGEVYNDSTGQYTGYLNAYPVVHCIRNNTVIWAQPIVISQNRYPNSTINSWDGSFKIDEENGTILSTMVSAGYKNTDNTYSGVLMGKIGGDGVADGNQTDVGVYGFHHGAQSFGLNIDGTAFFGKSGKGRILIDGNDSTIQSASYQQNKGGMLIDLDDGSIIMKSSLTDSKGQILIQTNASPYFKITSEVGKDIMYVGSNEYYLQSDNYTSSSGMKINLQNGYIDAYELKITSSNFTINSQGNDSSFKFNTKTILIDSTATGSNPYFRIRTTGEKDLIYVSGTSYYLQSGNYVSGSSGMNIDLSTGKINAYNFTLHGGSSTNYIELTSTPTLKMVSGGKTLMDVSTSNFLLQSSNWGVSGQKAAQFDIKNGKVTLTKDGGNEDNIVRMNIGATTYPFQIGARTSSGASTRVFRVNWDGKLYASNAEITGIITATSGTFSGTVYATSGTFSNGTISNCSIGNLTANGSINLGNYLTVGGYSLKANDAGNGLQMGGGLTVSGDLITTSGNIVTNGTAGYVSGKTILGNEFKFTNTGGADIPIERYTTNTTVKDNSYYVVSGLAIEKFLESSSGGGGAYDDTIARGESTGTISASNIDKMRFVHGILTSITYK